MKKSADTTIYGIYSQEINNGFLAFNFRFFSLKNDPTALCSPITFLFQEKLPIIYANIRV
jgi:hypothetical protein